jgi:hypothetical protein
VILKDNIFEGFDILLVLFLIKPFVADGYGLFAG